MKRHLVMIALGATFIAAPALAQAPGGGGGQRDQTRAEAQQRADFLFQMLDANHDNTLTRAEADQALAQFQAAQASVDDNGRGGGRARMLQGLIERAFATAQSLTQQQFEAMALARFDAQDLNHDGVVTVAEREQLRAQRAQARGAVGAATQSPAPPPQPHQ